MSSVAVRNNNPCNLRKTQPYEGLATPPERDGFANFVSPVWGFRAVARNYITKFDRGIDTISKLINEWAPPGDGNDTPAYIARVAKATGFGSDESIALKTWDVYSRVCYAQTEVETGEHFEANYTVAEMAEGAYRAGIVDAPKSPIAKVGVVVTGSVAAASGSAPAVIDAVNTYKPLIDQTSSHMLKTVFGVVAAVFAVLAIYNHIRSTK